MATVLLRSLLKMALLLSKNRARAKATEAATQDTVAWPDECSCGKARRVPSSLCPEQLPKPRAGGCPGFTGRGAILYSLQTMLVLSPNEALGGCEPEVPPCMDGQVLHLANIHTMHLPRVC